MLSHHILITAIVFGNLVFWTSQAGAQIPSATKIKSPAVRTALNSFGKDRAQLDESYVAFLKDLNDKYEQAVQLAKTKLTSAIEEARKEATINNKLDEAISLRDALSEIEELPTDVPLTRRTSNPSTARTGTGSADKGYSIESMTLDDCQEALCGKWKRTDGATWEFFPDGTMLSTLTNGQKERRDVNLRFRANTISIAFIQGNKYYVYTTTDFVVLHSTYSSATLRRIEP